MLSQEQQVVAAIRQIVRSVDLHSRRLVEAYGLTGPQLATLQAANRPEGSSPSAIAREVHLSQATVTGILQRLERSGLVERRRSQADRRGVVVTLAPAGRDLLDKAPSLLQDRFRQRLEELEEWERLMILAVLQRIAVLMDADRIDAAPHLVSGALGHEAADDAGLHPGADADADDTDHPSFNASSA